MKTLRSKVHYDIGLRDDFPRFQCGRIPGCEVHFINEPTDILRRSVNNHERRKIGREALLEAKLALQQEKGPDEADYAYVVAEDPRDPMWRNLLANTRACLR